MCGAVNKLAVYPSTGKELPDGDPDHDDKPRDITDAKETNDGEGEVSSQSDAMTSFTTIGNGGDKMGGKKVDILPIGTRDLWGTSSGSSPTGKEQAVFMKEGSRAGGAVGHLIPTQFWKYINSVDIAPDGWKTDFGPPLTEALAFNSREPDGRVGGSADGGSSRSERVPSRRHHRLR